MDINFDFRNDSKCGDPDTDSPKLYQAHKSLWDRELPCGKVFNLEIGSSYGRLVLKSDFGNLSSDRMCPHFDGKYAGKFDGWLSICEREELKYKVRNIGGHIIFPAHKKNGLTINQARGINRLIHDRFDLTLECIRRFYKKEQSPLYDTLIRYKDFFNLFVDFNGYTAFFMLQDFIDEKQQIIFFLPFDNFNRSALPSTVEEYEQYKAYTIDVVNKRNKRLCDFFENSSL